MAGYPDFTHGIATESAELAYVPWQPAVQAETGLLDVSPYRSIIAVLQCSTVGATRFITWFYGGNNSIQGVVSQTFIRFANNNNTVTMVFPVMARYFTLYVEPPAGTATGSMEIYGTTAQLPAGIAAPSSVADIMENQNVAAGGSVTVAPDFPFSGKAYVSLATFGSIQQAILYAYDATAARVPVWQARTSTVDGTQLPIYLPISDWDFTVSNVGTTSSGMFLRVTAEPYGG